MFGSEASYRNYLQATLASRLLLESMLETSHIEALLPQWNERRIEPDLANDINDFPDCMPPETLKFKRATEPSICQPLSGHSMCWRHPPSGFRIAQNKLPNSASRKNSVPGISTDR
ncbi:hypothetical protein AB664_13530 [Brucella anthropi]|uniref:Uncharacterized protein n=1 Tax=Brucella anthropi TaxID=529 RepID=A0A656Z375_BRUAN|nr:hypothetical protein AB664_13530 [Brucella anthropi]